MAGDVAVRMEENGNGNKSPWWSKTVWQLGPLAIGFLLLLGVFVGMVPSPLAHIQSMLQQHVEMDRTNQKLLRAICRNTAKTEIAQAECNN